MICKVSDSTSFFCSYDHQESSRSYLARHWCSGQNSMINRALHNRKTCSLTLPRSPQLYLFITRPNSHSLLHSISSNPPTPLSHSLLYWISPNSHQLPSFFRCQSLHTCPFSRPSFLHKPISLHISSPPQSPPSLINAAPHSLHQSHRHLPAIPSQIAR